MSRPLTLYLLLILLAACQAQVEPVLRLGSNVWPGYEPLYMARDLGELQKDKVRLVEYASASQVIQAFQNNLIDAAALTLDEALLLAARNEDIRIILVTDMSHGADAIVGTKNVTRMKELVGKRIGIEANALGAFVFTRAMDLHNIDPRSVNIISISVDDHENAFKQKLVDAVVTFEPVKSRLLSMGGNVLFDSKEIPGEIVDVIVVKYDYLNRFPGNIQHLVNVWFTMVNKIKYQPVKSAQRLSTRMRLNIDETLRVYEGLRLPTKTENESLLYGQPEPQLLINLKRLQKLMLDKKILPHAVDVSHLFVTHADSPQK